MANIYKFKTLDEILDHCVAVTVFDFNNKNKGAVNKMVQDYRAEHDGLWGLIRANTSFGNYAELMIRRNVYRLDDAERRLIAANSGIDYSKFDADALKDEMYNTLVKMLDTRRDLVEKTIPIAMIQYNSMELRDNEITCLYDVYDHAIDVVTTYFKHEHKHDMDQLIEQYRSTCGDGIGNMVREKADAVARVRADMLYVVRRLSDKNVYRVAANSDIDCGHYADVRDLRMELELRAKGMIRENDIVDRIALILDRRSN